jgi:hypothetical protein
MTLGERLKTSLEEAIRHARGEITIKTTFDLPDGPHGIDAPKFEPGKQNGHRFSRTHRRSIDDEANSARSDRVRPANLDLRPARTGARDPGTASVGTRADGAG